MAKKWTTLRKIDSPQEEEEAGGDAKKIPAPPRTPRRRQQAREQARNPQPIGPESVSSKIVPPADPSDAVRPLDVEEPRILVVHDAAATYRLVEETFGNFTDAKVDSTSDVLTAFELAILRDYQLFVIALTLPDMPGSLFYELISRAYKTGLGNRKLAPAVVYIREADEPLPSDEILQDVRVKAVWTKPLNIERMLDSVSSVIKVHNAKRS